MIIKTRGNNKLTPPKRSFHFIFLLKLFILSSIFLLINNTIYGQNPLPQSLRPKLLTQERIPETVKQLLFFELNSNKKNNPSRRNNRVIDLQHYEIPLKKTIYYFLSNNHRLKDSLIFEKNGRYYVRWIINPEDTYFHEKLKKYLVRRFIRAKKYYRFKGYLTASRSLIAYDPYNGSVFSIKVSTNHTGGIWNDKKLDSKRLFRSYYSTKHVLAIQKNFGFKHVVPMIESAGFALTSSKVDQSIIIRELGEVGQNKFYYLPGFSVVHDKTSRIIANINGAYSNKEIREFWKKNYVGVAGKALAEFSAKTGISYESAHGQNLGIEFDKTFRPTGRLIIRDFADYLSLPLIDKESSLYQKGKWYFPKKFIHYDRLVSRFGPLKVTTPPFWLKNSKDRLKWVDSFFIDFEKSFSAETGIDPKYLKKHSTKGGSAGTYRTKKYFL